LPPKKDVHGTCTRCHQFIESQLDDFIRTLQLNLVEAEDDDEIVPWSPMLLCAQLASQRGFVQNGRPDCMKAGTEILERVAGHQGLLA